MAAKSSTMSEVDLERLAYETLTEKARTNFIKIDGVFLPEDYKQIADAVENFEVRDDDVWVCSFQKSGTTWTQEMVWGICHELNFETAKAPINERFPFLEFSGIITTARVAMRDNNTSVPSWVLNSVEFCENLPSPRYIKCHLPFNLLPRQIRTGEKKPKIVYVSRNPKDVCISFYHHSKLLEGYCGNFEEFCELFLGDHVFYAPYWNHVNGYWDRSNMENLLLLRFEDMKMDLSSVIRRTAKFLGKNLSSDEVKLLADHLSFAKMKNNTSVNKKTTIEYINNMKVFGEQKSEGEFIRNGGVGQWKEAMSERMVNRFDEWIAKYSKH
ncbi:sulfotransferase 1C4-like [Trichogramma pretiosum]|uniref:sulfotransferase 1C4-like n=1 Tax=Trichogramma pretiosum TaxID=7493 RepID=UPI0006C980B2|nr:sulfotransferase 1C4-like [Trichogramma pretiosum]